MELFCPLGIDICTAIIGDANSFITAVKVVRLVLHNLIWICTAFSFSFSLSKLSRIDLRYHLIHCNIWRRFPFLSILNIGLLSSASLHAEAAMCCVKDSHSHFPFAEPKLLQLLIYISIITYKAALSVILFCFHHDLWNRPGRWILLVPTYG